MRARLQLATGDEHDAAFKGAKEAALQAAFAAALQSIPEGKRTVMPGCDGRSGAGGEQAGKGADSDGPGTGDANPLASLLGHYSDDDTAEDTAEDAAATAPSAADGAAAAGADPAPKGVRRWPLAGGESGKPELTEELAWFMQELHSSGLLNGADDSADGAARPGEHQQQQQEPQHQHDEGTDAQRRGEAGAAGPAAALGSSGGGTPHDGAAQAEGKPAEQRTLGILADAPEWCKVLDTGGGKVYYWNTLSNEVIWDAPPGADGDKLLPPPALGSPEANGGGGGGGDGSGGDGSGGGGGGGGAEAGAAGEGGAVTGAPPAAAGGGEVPAPSDEVEPVLEHLNSELRAAAQPLLAAAPAALRMLLQLEVLRQQWGAFAAEQRAAAAAGDAGRSLGWGAYERSVMQQLQGMFRKLQPAVEQLRERQAAEQATKQRAKGVGAAQAQQQQQRHHPQQEPCEEGQQPGKRRREAVGDTPKPEAGEAPPGAAPQHWPGAAGPAVLPGWVYQRWDGPMQAVAAAAAAPAAYGAWGAYDGAGGGFDYASYAGVAAAAPWPAAPGPIPPLPVGAAPLAPVAAPAVAVPAEPHSPPLPVEPPGPVDACAAGRAGLLPAAVPFQPPLPPEDPDASSSGEDTALGHRTQQQQQKQQQHASAGKKRPAVPAAKAPAAGVGAKRGRTAALLDKWSAVRRDLEAEDEAARRAAEERDDPDARERARRRDIEEWRLEQLRGGAAAANPNFAPLGLGGAAVVAAASGVKKLKKEKKAAAAKPAAAEGSSNGFPTHSAEKPDLDALSAGLPPGWRAMWDCSSGAIYYGNPDTKETSWSRP